MFENKVKEIEEREQCSIALLLQPLSEQASLPAFHYKEQHSFSSASMIKVVVLVAALKAVEEGIMTLQNVVVMKDEDYVDFSVIQEQKQKTCTVEELLTWMIITSDNSATNAIISLLGLPFVQRVIDELALQQTKLQRKMMDHEAMRQGCDNMTSAEDMAKLFIALEQSTYLSNTYSEYALRILKRQRDTSMLKRYIADDVEVAHKTGELQHVRHDAGLFYTREGVYFLGIFIEGHLEGKHPEQWIGTLSQEIYKKWMHSYGKRGSRYVVSAPIGTLRLHPYEQAEIADEALYGTIVTVLREEGDWYFVETEYRYQGYIHQNEVWQDVERTQQWKVKEKTFIIQNFADILYEPRIQAAKMIHIPRGGKVVVMNRTEYGSKGNFTEVELVDGQHGWILTKHLQQMKKHEDEPTLRQALVHTAKLYMGAQYRWGGKTGEGIDCSGLCFMAYWLNGMVIYRDACIHEDFPIRSIKAEELREGDLIFFPGHVAMYIGDSLYIHSSLGATEVGVNSLNEEHLLYHHDLATSITEYGSYF